MEETKLQGFSTDFSVSKALILNDVNGQRSVVSYRKKRFVFNPECRTTWIYHYQSDRDPPSIRMAVCSGKCEEVSVLLPVKIFHGMTPSGDQIWRSERQSVKIGCVGK